MSSWKYASATAPKKSCSETAPLDLRNAGKYLLSKECAACHTMGHREKIGLDLRGITNVRDGGWLRRFIHEPDKMIAEKRCDCGGAVCKIQRSANAKPARGRR
jgi:hypothetical protein